MLVCYLYYKPKNLLYKKFDLQVDIYEDFQHVRRIRREENNGIKNLEKNLGHVLAATRR
jgi:hypothetical protein